MTTEDEFVPQVGLTELLRVLDRVDRKLSAEEQQTLRVGVADLLARATLAEEKAREHAVSLGFSGTDIAARDARISTLEASNATLREELQDYRDAATAEAREVDRRGKEIETLTEANAGLGAA